MFIQDWATSASANTKRRLISLMQAVSIRSTYAIKKKKKSSGGLLSDRKCPLSQPCPPHLRSG